MLDRDGQTVVLEPYAPNVLRIILSTLKDYATAAPGPGKPPESWPQPELNSPPMPKSLLAITLAAALSPASAQTSPPQAPSPSCSILTPDLPAHHVRVSSVVMAANRIGGDQPIYPPKAKAAGIEGTIVLIPDISISGIIERLCAITGPPVLRQPAYDAVRTWTYIPFILKGQPTAVQTQINVKFHLSP